MLRKHLFPLFPLLLTSEPGAQEGNIAESRPEGEPGWVWKLLPAVCPAAGREVGEHARRLSLNCGQLGFVPPPSLGVEGLMLAHLGLAEDDL